MFVYSLKKKSDHLNPEYSVIQPATNSDSASGISNGVLFVSATPEMKNIIKAINVKGECIISHLLSNCQLTMEWTSNPPEIITGSKSVIPIGSKKALTDLLVEAKMGDYSC